MYKNARKGYDLMLYGGNRKNNMKAISIKKKLVKYNNQGSLIEFIYFQACTYKYFEIRIDKYANVSKAGYIHQKTPDKSYVRLSLPEIQQKLIKNSKNSQIQISYNIPQRIDLLKINISGTDFYYRDANLSIKDSSFYKKKKKYYYRQIIRFKLNSDCTPFVYLNDFRAETFYLDIENKDNLPLKIDSIECYQKKHYLIAKLENNKSYFLRCGNSRTTKAQYDLQYFTDKIPKHLKTLKISETKHIHPIAKKTDKGFEPDKKVIWIVIIFISIILLYITVKMLKNTDN